MSSEDMAALARHALGHATVSDMERILRMAGECDTRNDTNALPEESWLAVDPPRPGSIA